MSKHSNKTEDNGPDAHEPYEHSAEDLSQIHPAAVPFLWLGRPSFQRNFIWIPVTGLLITIVLGFVYHHKHPAPWDFFASWAVIGFLAYSFVVLSAEPLFRLLSRPEDYYEDGNTLPPIEEGDSHD